MRIRTRAGDSRSVRHRTTRAGRGSSAESSLGPGGQGHLPQGPGPEQDLLGEVIRLPHGVPLPKRVGLPPNHPEHAYGGPARTLLPPGKEVQGGHQRLLEPVHPVGPRGVLQRGEVLERPDDATGTVVPEPRGLGRGCQPLGELPDQGVQADAVGVEFLDEPDVMQAVQGPFQGGNVAGRGE